MVGTVQDIFPEPARCEVQRQEAQVSVGASGQKSACAYHDGVLNELRNLANAIHTIGYLHALAHVKATSALFTRKGHCDQT
eukprot:CAMPEP_0204575074 /NCGR_PEP_ID=MMETSP0661-20131031/40973_1 /ASSEMBLY_ACC=CAM_ASM_000606 /TAXON_ID=109239 /ORGANISM="Alexandrium margalefi, Strain AMGDE01CS-322" /LENGTH=80 /DNA_ID=CAMNT_0051583655 /DNA_START=467 /DNA_END=705 /DNA_ORIENTATION=+